MSLTDTLETHTPPVMVLNGFGNTAPMSERTAQIIAASLGAVAIAPPPDTHVDDVQRGFRITYVDRDERVGTLPQAVLASAKPDTKSVVPLHQENRAEGIIAQAEKSKAPIFAIFQSVDALSGVIAVSERPELFDSVLFAHPAGLIAKERTTEHSRRMLSLLKTGVNPIHTPIPENDLLGRTKPQQPRSLKDKIQHARRRRTEKRFNNTGGFPVAASVAVSSQNELLHEARLSPDAPAVSLLLGMQDAMMDPVRIIDSLVSPDDVDTILITNTAHGMNGDKMILEAAANQLAVAKQIQENRKAGVEIGNLVDRITFMPDVSEEQRAKVLKAIDRLEDKNNAHT